MEAGVQGTQWGSSLARPSAAGTTPNKQAHEQEKGCSAGDPDQFVVRHCRLMLLL